MPVLSPSRSERLAALKAEVRAIESLGTGGARECLPFGVEAIDARLAGGGLATGRGNERTGARGGAGGEAAANLLIGSGRAKGWKPGTATRRRAGSAWKKKAL